MHVSSSNSSAELSSAKASKYSIWPKWTDDELVPDKRVSAMHGLKRGTDCIMAMQPKVANHNNYCVFLARNRTNQLVEMQVPGQEKGQSSLQE